MDLVDLIFRYSPQCSITLQTGRRITRHRVFEDTHEQFMMSVSWRMREFHTFTLGTMFIARFEFISLDLTSHRPEVTARAWVPPVKYKHKFTSAVRSSSCFKGRELPLSLDNGRMRRLVYSTYPDEVPRRSA